MKINYTLLPVTTEKENQSVSFQCNQIRQMDLSVLLNKKKPYFFVENNKTSIFSNILNHSFLLNNNITLYVRNNTIIQLPTDVSYKSYKTKKYLKTKYTNLNYLNISILDNFIFGNIKCYYLHGMGYKCGSAINSLYFSMGRTQWDSVQLTKGNSCYSIARKKSWRKRIIRDQLLKIISTDRKKQTISLIKERNLIKKKRKLRTRVKLLRNYHGLLFIYSINIHQLGQIDWKIRKMNIPNVYTGKGIHSYREQFKPQARKLKSFFYKK